MSSLQYIFRSNIINTATQQVILQTLTDNNINTGPPKWPGKEFAIDSQEGRALMGTANGNGVAWILFSHREQLGWKSIKVRIPKCRYPARRLQADKHARHESELNPK